METPKEHEERPLTEEELFLEEVLLAKDEALREERERRLSGIPPKKRLNVSARLIVWLMAATLFFSTFAILFQIYSIPAIEFIQTSSKLSQQEDIKAYKLAVVEVSTGQSKGTGFAISSDGYIITNSHVVKGNEKLSIIFPEDGMHSGSLVADYPEVDLALIKIEGEDFPHLTVAANFVEQHGEAITFIGNPLYFTGIANKGHVIETTVSSLESNVIMIEAPVYKGNSGSPVLNAAGEVIGVIYATSNTEAYGKVGLFIPIDELHKRFTLDK